MSDKVRQLAEKLYCEPDERWTTVEPIEELLHAHLKPLLDAAERATGVYVEDDSGEKVLSRLAAELKGWTPDGR